MQLLFKLSISASDAPNKKLLKLIKNPVTDHLPTGCRKICMTYNAEKSVRPVELVPADDRPIVIVVGAIATGSVSYTSLLLYTHISMSSVVHVVYTYIVQITPDYTEEDVAISNYPLSAALTCTKICTAFEEAWNVEDKITD